MSRVFRVPVKHEYILNVWVEDEDCNSAQNQVANMFLDAYYDSGSLIVNLGEKNMAVCEFKPKTYAQMLNEIPDNVDASGIEKTK